MVAGLFGLKNDHSIQYLMKIIWEQVYYFAVFAGSDVTVGDDRGFPVQRSLTVPSNLELIVESIETGHWCG
jgi:hypothetical protein